MKAIRFHIVIDEDQVIRLPQHVVLPSGPAEVIVLHSEANGQESEKEELDNGTSEPQDTPSKKPWSLAARLAQRAQELQVDDLPPDLAKNHDHYLHGLPKCVFAYRGYPNECDSISSHH